MVSATLPRTYCNPHTLNVGRSGSPKVTQNIGQTTFLVRRELLSVYAIQPLDGNCFEPVTDELPRLSLSGSDQLRGLNPRPSQPPVCFLLTNPQMTLYWTRTINKYFDPESCSIAISPIARYSRIRPVLK